MGRTADHVACFDLVKRSMGNDQRIGMVSVLVMRQYDRRRRSQFCLTHLGEHGEWFKTTPKSGALYDSSG